MTSQVFRTEYFVAFYPQFNFDYVDKEPCRAPLSTSSIKSLLSYPRMGYSFWLAFVGEPIQSAVMKCPYNVNDWGDGTGFSDLGSNVHTYAAPGLYWAQLKDGPSAGCKAVRPVRVIYRQKPSVYGPFDRNYPVWMTDAAEVSETTSTAFRFTVRVDGRVAADTIGQMSDRTGVAIFAQEYVGRAPSGTLKLVCGGYLSEPNKTLTQQYNDFSFVAKGLTNWLNQTRATMREQQYTNPEMQALIMGADAAAAASVGTILSTDYLQEGYVPNHWVACDTVNVGLHVAQHVQVWTYAPYPNPLMLWPQDILGYGGFSQFCDLVTDGDFDYATGLPGSKFQNFDVPPGQVLSNIRNLIANEGWVFYDRADTSLRFERAHFYRTTPADPVLVLDDLGKAGDNLDIQGGDEIAVREIIVERPPDGLPMPDGVVSAPGMKSPYDSMAARDAYDPSECASGSSSPPNATEHNKALGWYNANRPLMEKTADAGGSDVNPFFDFDPLQYIYKYPNAGEGDTLRTSGLTINIKGIYSLSLRAIAIGKDRETRSRFIITVALLQTFGVDIGDIVTVTHTLGDPYNKVWINKRFYVSQMNMTLDGAGIHVRQLTLKETNPDE